MTKQQRTRLRNFRAEERLTRAWSRVALIAGSLWMLSLWILMGGE